MVQCSECMVKSSASGLASDVGCGTAQAEHEAAQRRADECAQAGQNPMSSLVHDTSLPMSRFSRHTVPPCILLSVLATPKHGCRARNSTATAMAKSGCRCGAVPRQATGRTGCCAQALALGFGCLFLVCIGIGLVLMMTTAGITIDSNQYADRTASYSTACRDQQRQNTGTTLLCRPTTWIANRARPHDVPIPACACVPAVPSPHHSSYALLLLLHALNPAFHAAKSKRNHHVYKHPARHSS